MQDRKSAAGEAHEREAVAPLSPIRVVVQVEYSPDRGPPE